MTKLRDVILKMVTLQYGLRFTTLYSQVMSVVEDDKRLRKQVDRPTIKRVINVLVQNGELIEIEYIVDEKTVSDRDRMHDDEYPEAFKYDKQQYFYIPSGSIMKIKGESNH
jgi:hypothetical protein